MFAFYHQLNSSLLKLSVLIAHYSCFDAIPGSFAIKRFRKVFIVSDFEILLANLGDKLVIEPFEKSIRTNSCQEFIICTHFVAWCARVPLIHVYPKDPHSYLKKSTNHVSHKLFDCSVRDFYCSIKRYVIKKIPCFFDN